VKEFVILIPPERGTIQRKWKKYKGRNKEETQLKDSSNIYR
jgi:hypothetical protein